MQSNKSFLTSQSLIARIGKQDESSWKLFVKLYAPLVYSWSRSAGLQPNDVYDVAQEVFTAVYKNIGTFQPDPQKETGAFRSWLWGITKYKLRDHYRSLSDHPNGQGGTDIQLMFQQIHEDAEEPETVDGLNPRQILQQSAFDLLQKEFDSKTWQCFWKMSVDGETAREIGEQLNMTAKAVRQAKYRVVLKLRELLTDDFPDLLNELKDK